MRTISLYIPALICASSMIICVRMMSRGHRDRTNQQHDDQPPAQPRREEQTQ